MTNSVTNLIIIMVKPLNLFLISLLIALASCGVDESSKTTEVSKEAYRLNHELDSNNTKSERLLDTTSKEGVFEAINDSGMAVSKEEFLERMKYDSL